jgi:hypothetical protein
MDKFKKLVQHCKCGVYLQVNAHRDVYETAKQHLEHLEIARGEPLDIPADVRKVMEDTDTIVSLQWYPRTPIGFDEVYHHDIDAAMDAALACLEA